MSNQTVPTAFLEHLKRRKDEAKAVLLSAIDAERASFLDVLNHIESALLQSTSKDLALTITRKAMRRYEKDRDAQAPPLP